jgi:hypothetical protein
MAAWNALLPVMQRGRHADLAGVLLPVLKQLLQVCASNVGCTVAHTVRTHQQPVLLCLACANRSRQGFKAIRL